MKALLLLLTLLTLSACVVAEFPGADRSHILGCRLEARAFPPLQFVARYNACMRSLGYEEYRKP